MFELNIAAKYLLPRWRRLSLSLISLIAIGVISLVVWLILVFFSVTNGLEKMWIEKLIVLSGPARITPTDAYYKSHYYLIDSFSAASDYQSKSLEEKLNAPTNPWNPNVDPLLPRHFPTSEGKDLVKELMGAIKEEPQVEPVLYEVAPATIQILINRPVPKQEGKRIQMSYEGQIQHAGFVLSKNTLEDDGVLLPKSFQDAGAIIGDKGYLLYEAPSLAATTQVQLPIQVAGFYDPGLMAMGGKFILTSPEIAALIRSSTGADTLPDSNGIQLLTPDYTKITEIKNRLEKKLEALGLSPYFKIETYEEYDFARSFIQELKSQKNVFLILAGMIILVACSNIISMLIILVNDKKKEIGILRALGARTLSIGSIFGFIGLSMGVIGSCLGILMALITLQCLPSLIGFLSRMQGFDAFQRLFYNSTFPTSISIEALQFVLIATTLTSLLAALIPAIKACTVKPAAMLRSE